MTTEPPRLDEAEIKDLARRIVTNVTWITNDPEAMQMAFGLVVGLMNWSDYDVTKVGGIYEDLAKALPRSINGFPMFTSAHLLHVDDLGAVKAEVERMEEALGG